MIHSYVEIFFQFIIYGPTMGRANTLPTDWVGLPPHTTGLPTTTGSSGYIFVVSFHVLYIIYWCCITMSQKNIKFINYDPTLGTAETQPTDWVWPPTPHHCFANSNRQQRIYFCSEFSCSLDFLQMLHNYVKNFFNLIVMVPTWEWQKLSPQAEFDLPPCTTTLPKSTASGMFILKVSFNYLHLFC